MKAIEEQSVLITGSTDGMGERTAHDLAADGATMLLHGQDPRNGARVAEVISCSTGNDRPLYLGADLSSLSEVRDLAGQPDGMGIDVLINNAGIGPGPPGAGREVCRDGHELRMAVNSLAPFLLTHLLLPNLRRAEPTRIVNVASPGQDRIVLDDLMMERHYDGWEAYGRNKLALIMFTIEFADRLGDTPITINTLHPGSLLDTNLVRQSWMYPRGDAQEGIDSIRALATPPGLESTTGRFFDRGREVRPDEQAYDSHVRRGLEITGARESVQALSDTT